MICKECKTETNGTICQNCGYKNTSKKKKIIITTVASVLSVAFIISLIFMFVKIKENKNIEICVSEGQLFSELMDNSKSNMNIIGMFHSSSTKLNYGYSWDEEYFTNYVTELNSAEISEEKTNRLNIITQYKSIKDIENTNDEIKKFQKQVDNLYNAYEDMYDLLIEQNFTYKNFESKYTQMKNEFDMALELYNDVLEKLNADSLRLGEGVTAR